MEIGNSPLKVNAKVNTKVENKAQSNKAQSNKEQSDKSKADSSRKRTSSKESSSKASKDVDPKNYDDWVKKAKSTLVSLDSSQEDVINFLTKTYKDGKASSNQLQLVQTFLSMRRETTEFLSNAYKTLSEGALSVIRNMRS